MTKCLYLVIAIAALSVSCARTPYTQRRQLMLVSEDTAAELGAKAFQEVLKKTEVETNPRYSEPVAAVGRRIARVSSPTSRIATDKWRFVTLEDEKVQNAFALPGGSVGVYTGMFPLAQTTEGLAVVMAHEVGHVIARHGSERMSQALATQVGGSVLGVALGGGASTQAILTAYGLGAQLGVLLPYSRTQETEADRIGLLLMAEAGYDPRAAVGFWQRMGASGDRKQPPEFLSTHPGHKTRIVEIQKHLPEALARYPGASRAPVETLPSVPGS